MKRNSLLIRGLVLAGLLVFGYANVTIAAPSAPDAQAATEQTRTFTIENMTCPLCPVTVHKAMTNVDGVKSVDVDFDAKTATVRFDPAVTTVEEIAHASTNAGYPATVSAGS